MIWFLQSEVHWKFIKAHQPPIMVCDDYLFSEASCTAGWLQSRCQIAKSGLETQSSSDLTMDSAHKGQVLYRDNWSILKTNVMKNWFGYDSMSLKCYVKWRGIWTEIGGILHRESSRRGFHSVRHSVLVRCMRWSHWGSNSIRVIVPII